MFPTTCSHENLNIAITISKTEKTTKVTGEDNSWGPTIHRCVSRMLKHWGRWNLAALKVECVCCHNQSLNLAMNVPMIIPENICCLLTEFYDWLHHFKYWGMGWGLVPALNNIIIIIVSVAILVINMLILSENVIISTNKNYVRNIMTTSNKLFWTVCLQVPMSTAYRKSRGAYRKLSVHV